MHPAKKVQAPELLHKIVKDYPGGDHAGLAADLLRRLIIDGQDILQLKSKHVDEFRAKKIALFFKVSSSRAMRV